MVKFLPVSLEASNSYLSLLFSSYVPVRLRFKALICSKSSFFSFSKINKVDLWIPIMSLNLVTLIRSVYLSFLAPKQSMNNSSKVDTLNLANKREDFTPLLSSSDLSRYQQWKHNSWFNYLLIHLHFHAHVICH